MFLPFRLLRTACFAHTALFESTRRVTLLFKNVSGRYNPLLNAWPPAVCGLCLNASGGCNFVRITSYGLSNALLNGLPSWFLPLGLLRTYFYLWGCFAHTSTFGVALHILLPLGLLCTYFYLWGCFAHTSTFGVALHILLPFGCFAYALTLRVALYGF
jgi:hypothetical protein